MPAVPAEVAAGVFVQERVSGIVVQFVAVVDVDDREVAVSVFDDGAIAVSDVQEVNFCHIVLT